MRINLRFIPGWKRLLLIAAPVAMALGVTIAAYLYTTSMSAAATPPPPAADPALDLPSQPGLLVHVVGAVESPGLYRLPRGDRVFDAIAAAGGLSPDADLARLPNFAGRLRDGEQIKVAFARSTSGTVIVRVNLNQATLAELLTIPGFTQALAEECIDYRVSFGGFQNSRELVDILGMSEAAYVIARRYVTL
jgi:competence protein ComEA